MRNKNKTRSLCVMAMFAALAFVLMLVLRLPVVASAPYLKYDPKDIMIVICGFTEGPIAALLVSLVVALLEMVTVGSTGLIGFAMNFISSAAFAVVAALFYSRRRSLRQAVYGICCGVLAMTALMLLWNYFLTPLYTGYPRETVAAMLPTVFLPFNLIKGIINAAVTMLIYKPISKALRRTGLTEQLPTGEATGVSVGKKQPLVWIIAGAVLIICIVAVLLLK